jgi:hypothetical protein
MPSLSGGVNGSRVVLPVVATDDALKETRGVYGSGFLVRTGVFITCRHCLPQLPAGQRLAVARRNANGSYEAFPLSDVEPDARGHDLATARVPLDAEEQWPLYQGVMVAGMSCWSFGYPLPEIRPEPFGPTGFAIAPRFVRGYVMRRYNGAMVGGRSFPCAELDMTAPPGLSGAPILYENSDQILGVYFGRRSTKVPDEDPAPLYTFSLAYDNEILAGLKGKATGNRNVGELCRVW